MSITLLVPQTHDSALVRQEGTHVLLIADGKLLFDMTWQEADQLASAIRRKAREVEEIVKAEQIIFDNALLLRGGVPIGLSDHPNIQKETATEAAWNSQIRRWLPGGVKSKEIVPAPRVRSLDSWRRRMREQIDGVGR